MESRCLLDNYSKRSTFASTLPSVTSPSRMDDEMIFSREVFSVVQIVIHLCYICAGASSPPVFRKLAALNFDISRPQTRHLTTTPKSNAQIPRTKCTLLTSLTHRLTPITLPKHLFPMQEVYRTHLILYYSRITRKDPQLITTINKLFASQGF